MNINSTFTRNPLDGSMCSTCKHMVKRIIIPLEEREYGIDREAMGIPENEEIRYEHYFCTETALDLDHIVVECSLYKTKSDNKLINTDF